MAIPTTQTASAIASHICIGLALAILLTGGGGNTLFTALSIAIIPLLISGFGE